MEITAMPYHKGDRRIMFQGCNNFGEGSYNKKHAMHVFSLKGRFIIPVTVTRVAQDRNEAFQGKPELVGTVTYNAMGIDIFEK